MDQQAIYERARAQTATNKQNMPDDKMRPIFNEARRIMYDELLIINENYFVQKENIDLVAYQTEYTLTDPTASVRSADKFLYVGVKYDNSQYLAWTANTSYSKDQVVLYLGATYVAKEDVVGAVSFQSASFQEIFVDYAKATETTYYDEGEADDVNSNGGNAYLTTSGFKWASNVVGPRYIRGNNTVEIYPAPQKSITKGLRLIYIPTCTDATADNGTEASILVPRGFHDTIVQLMRPEIFRYQKMENEAQAAEGKAERALDRALRKARARSYDTFEQETDLSGVY